MDDRNEMMNASFISITLNPEGNGPGKKEIKRCVKLHILKRRRRRRRRNRRKEATKCKNSVVSREKIIASTNPSNVLGNPPSDTQQNSRVKKQTQTYWKRRSPREPARGRSGAAARPRQRRSPSCIGSTSSRHWLDQALAIPACA